MSNRVEELESQVAELQAAVDGLTEELVETRERLRALEDAAETGADRHQGRDRPTSERVTHGTDEPTGEERQSAGDDGDEVAFEEDADADADADDGSTSDDDSGTDEIIIA